MDGGRTIPGIDDLLLSYLRSELQDQRLTYSTPPTPVEGETRCNCPSFSTKGRCSHSAAVMILTQLRGYRPRAS